MNLTSSFKVVSNIGSKVAGQLGRVVPYLIGGLPEYDAYRARISAKNLPKNDGGMA
jgi:hypothetical protein